MWMDEYGTPFASASKQCSLVSRRCVHLSDSITRNAFITVHNFGWPLPFSYNVDAIDYIIVVVVVHVDVVVVVVVVIIVDID